jgi:indolepyruvate ferredoxin oxidoreductase
VNWPLEPVGIREFAEGLDEILVVEEKRGVIEAQIKEQLYNWRAGGRPVIVGKRDEGGAWMLPSTGELTPSLVARAIGQRLERYADVPDVHARLVELEKHDAETASLATKVQRLPHFCSGCPHNTSTRVPEGSRAVGGIGCHFMAGWMDRNTVTYTQMGGEGATWIGQAPFTSTPHVFQNLGDGTYAHSGTLAIRAAVAAGVNMTYKILFNDAVAMTGGQPVEGHLTVQNVVGQLIAEGVKPIYVLSDHIEKYRGAARLPESVTIADRRELDRVQRILRERKGVSALIFDQTCAAELHRMRKRGTARAPSRRVVINELVCEGCGDCNVQSNCLSVMALETEFGRKRRINQSSCNQDFSCLEGFCPSFVTLDGAGRNPPKPLASETVPSLPDPEPPKLTGVCNILIAGVGGTGVVTASGLIGLAAHLEGKAVVQLDQTGLAQKFGAVLSHVRIADAVAEMHGNRIPRGQVDILLGADLMVAAGTETLAMLSPERSSVIVNTHAELPSQFILDRDFEYPVDSMLDALRRRGANLSTLDATHLASALLGDSIAANIFMLGFAFQRGLLPLSGVALYRALELFGVNVAGNKDAFNWGRFAAHNPSEVAELAVGGSQDPEPATALVDIVERRVAFLGDYQDAAYAERYRARVKRIEALEHKLDPSSQELAKAVARSYFKLLAYKDEYEVARLHVQTSFLDDLRRNFRNDFKLRFHFSPPLIASIDPTSGRPKKYAFGPWILPFLKLLARMRRLRGGPFDLFGRTAERRRERQLISDYEDTLDLLEREADVARMELACSLASWPDAVRGFGPIKLKAMDAAERHRGKLLADWQAASGDAAAAPRVERSSAA